MRRRWSLAIVLVLAGFLPASAPAAELDKIQSLAERGRTEEALSKLDALLIGDPSQLEARFLRGVLLAELGRNSEAERAFQMLIQEHPERPEPTNNLAVLQALGGRPATAIVTLEALVDRFPTYVTAARNLATIRRGSGGGFDPLSPEAARMPLALTAQLGSYPAAPSAAGPAPAGSPAEPPAAPDAPPEARARPAAVVPAPEPEAASPTTAPEPRAQPVGTAPEAEPAPAPVAVSEPEAAAPEPTAAAATPPAATDLRAQLEPVVAAWAEAWSQQRVRDYLGFYAGDFQPEGFASRDAWESTRRQRVAAPSFIEVEIDLDSMTVRETGPDGAEVTFVQRYRSDRFGDTVEKTLGFVRRDGAWRIRSESSR